MSDPAGAGPPDPAPQSAPRPARLDFRRDRAASTILDGAWWPRSHDTATELAALVVALGRQQVMVDLIMLNPAEWSGHPHWIGADGRALRVSWFDDLDSAILIATTRYDRVDLLIVFDDDADGNSARASGSGAGLSP